jgi:hypothetical protein
MVKSHCSWFGTMLLLAGCSALVNVGGKQCESNAQCVSAKLGDRCENNVCVASGDVDGGKTGGTCMNDAQCGGDTPRCMNSHCVSNEIADRWLCSTEPAAQSGTIVHYSFHAVEFVSRAAAMNIVASACLTTDAGCTAPVATFKDTKATGLVALDLPYGFLGFIQVTSDALPALSYLTKPLTKDTVDRDLPVLSQSTLELLSSIIGLSFDPTKGVALVDAFDCSGSPAGGVEISESRGTSTRFYVVDSAPSLDAMVTVYDSVANVADAGFLNIQPGFVTFQARSGVDGPELGSFNALVRPNTITFVDMHF